MSVIPGFGGEDHYEEPLPPHDEEMEDPNAPVSSAAAEVPGSSTDVNPVNGVTEKSSDKMENENNTSKDQSQDDGQGNGMLDDDDESEDDEFVVTIGQVKQNVPFSNVNKIAAGVSAGKLDIDATATINGQPIYDVDLAAMEDRPWRKPGADITDYFNYGFCEETWNSYCERQRKLRAEYGTQAAVNKAIFSSINLVNPISQTNLMPGGRQLQAIPILGQEKSAMDLSGFKSSVPLDQQPVIRTVLTMQQPRTIGTGGTAGTSVSNAVGLLFV